MSLTSATDDSPGGTTQGAQMDSLGSVFKMLRDDTDSVGPPDDETRDSTAHREPIAEAFHTETIFDDIALDDDESSGQTLTVATRKSDAVNRRSRFRLLRERAGSQARGQRHRCGRLDRGADRRPGRRSARSAAVPGRWRLG